MTAKDILSASEMKINLTQDSVEILLSGKDSPIVVPFDQMTSIEAVSLRLHYAKEVILPGQNTSTYFKQEESKGE